MHEARQRYAHSRTRIAVFVVLALIAIVSLIGAGFMKGAAILYVIAAILFLIVWASRGVIRARFLPTNWLAILVEDGVYLKYRSHLNYHFPDTEPSVVFVGFKELRAARLVKSRQTMPSATEGGTTMVFRTLVRLELRDSAQELAEAFAKERSLRGPRESRWYGSSSGRFRHYPIRLSRPDEIEIEWRVQPAAKDFLSAIAIYVPVESIEERFDFRDLKDKDPREQETRLIELVESGQQVAAIKVARSIYGFDLTEAKTFVDGLSGKAPTRQ